MLICAFGKGCLKINKFDVTIPFNEQDVPIVNILDVTREQLNAQWDSLPEMVKLGEHHSQTVGCR